VEDQKVRVVFMGSPEFAVATLDALVSAPDIDLVRVVTQPDRPSGRGKKMVPTAVKAYALERGIPVEAMTREGYADVVAGIAALEPDFIVVASFGVILRRDLLDIPKFGCVNLHASLLPKYRGMSPIQTAILAGEERTGCTTMMMDEGVDTGDMLLAESIEIAAEDTAGSLERKLAELGAPLVVETLRGLREGRITPRPQDHDGATHTKRIKKEHGAIDWNETAETISRQVRAMLPWPAAFTTFSGKRLIVLEAAAVPAERTEPGVVLSTSPLTVGTGDGALEIGAVKVEGKKEMPARAFLSGYRIKEGDRIG
jgi:methionyl-tRNA formyltransferase